MTWSIAAFDQKSGMVGVCVTTKFFGVGSLAPFARSGVGAVATQAFVNPTFGPRGLRLLEEGLTPQQVLEALLASDDGREHRQLAVVDRFGNVAQFTGAECVDWAGHRAGESYAVQGNMLVGQPTIDATAEAFEANANQPLPERLLRAIEAGQAAGGDKRGRQSAALLVYSTEEYPHLDLRVDDSADPVPELRRLFEEAKREFLVFQQFLPTRDNPCGVYQREKLAQVMALQAENDKQR